LGGYGAFANSCLVSAHKTSACKEFHIRSTLAACVLLDFSFGKLPLQHLPLARIMFCAILSAFVPAKKYTPKGTLLKNLKIRFLSKYWNNYEHYSLC